jgi:hypothetical protein
VSISRCLSPDAEDWQTMRLTSESTAPENIADCERCPQFVVGRGGTTPMPRERWRRFHAVCQQRRTGFRSLFENRTTVRETKSSLPSASESCRQTALHPRSPWHCHGGSRVRIRKSEILSSVSIWTPWPPLGGDIKRRKRSRAARSTARDDERSRICGDSTAPGRA